MLEFSLPDFQSKDLLAVHATVTVNADPLHGILIQLIRTLQKVVKKTGELDENIQGVAKEIISTRGALELKILDVQRNVDGQLTALRLDVNTQLTKMRDEAKADRTFLHQNVQKITDEVHEAREQLERQVREVKESAEALEERLSAGVNEVVEQMSALSSSVSARFEQQNRELTQLKEDSDLLVQFFDVTRQQVRASLEHRDPTKRVQLLHSTPAFKRILDDLHEHQQAVVAKVDSVQTHVDGLRREVMTKVTMTEFEEFKRTVRQDDLRRQVTQNRDNIDRLFEGQTLLEKNTHLLDQKKADTLLLMDLKGAIAQLDNKLMEQLSKDDQDKMEDLLDKIAELQHSLEKMDRRKVGRAEFNKISKTLKAGVGVGAFGDGFEQMMVTGNGAPPLSISGDAAFLRYRCLSCNKPAAKITDEVQKRPVSQFPPSPVLLTPATRHNQKVQNYFEWVGQGTPPPGGGVHGTNITNPVPMGETDTTLASSPSQKDIITPGKMRGRPGSAQVTNRPGSAGRVK